MKRKGEEGCSRRETLMEAVDGVVGVRSDNILAGGDAECSVDRREEEQRRCHGLV